ncbi:MAG: acyl-CoA dehydrogenase, partial [Leptospiraceae bacterium]|nr:acyl-CoA dehydrogenase [Leptospiraceae bacterium]
TRINTIYEGTSQIQVRIGIGGLTSGMEQNGFVRKYIEEKWSEINTHPEILIEQREILETSLKLYKGLSSDTLKEKLAEDVIIIASRFLCSMYFCHATEKAESLSGLEYWKEDCFDFLVDSAGIMNSSLYKIKKYGGV